MEEFKWQIYCKNWFSELAFYVTIADADIGSLKSLHTLFDKYLDHKLVTFEQNRMVPTIKNFVRFDKKWLTIFDKSVDAVLEDVPVTETIVWCYILIWRLSSFSALKIAVVRHV